MKDRIKKIRKELGLTQQEFADKMGVKRNNIAGYETGKRLPSDGMIVLICREFNVNEDWLRNGIGDMFIKLNREEEIALWVGKILGDESAKFQRRFISALSKMNEAGWNALEKVLKDLYEENEEDKND